MAMEWRPRTKKTPGKYHKIMLEEEPPKFLMKPLDGYDDIIEKAKEMFWKDDKRNEAQYTLCNADGSRWPKSDFEKEYFSLNEIPDIWKKTLYVGRRDLDDVICVGQLSLASKSENLTQTKSMLMENAAMDNPILQETSGHLKKSSTSCKRKPTMDNLQAQLSGSFSFELMVSSSKKHCSLAIAENMEDGSLKSDVQTPPHYAIPPVYMPRVPYVDDGQIKFNPDLAVGSGSFGTVYFGSYQGTPAAVKKIPVDDSNDFLHEILVCLRLSHPNIVRFLAATKKDQYILIANEYVHGASLHVVLHSADSPVKLEAEEKNYVALDVAMAVEYIHSKNVIHQDLKPANILIEGSSKKAYLTDWGLANVRDSVSLRQGSKISGLLSGPLGGTAIYTAPECLLTFQPCSVHSDIWSIGITFLELYTNTVPWSVKTCAS
ncbi:proto-oncogene serine/threonine-protein kinase mos-like [Erpetoichthys calabaricus]|uniref:proto-oncogene serine/threonine-protein kinase mos-like n=1 Tax=Erpetoichthys calabaricus TaxID=27687 RepID=UPI0022346C3C|nr:proto-oncogene serine/threonine-protein kinase mos-like [Erpetoichthys calabaricus]